MNDGSCLAGSRPRKNQDIVLLVGGNDRLLLRIAQVFINFVLRLDARCVLKVFGLS